MNRLTDQQLLAAYAERHEEAAFAELVHRHIDLVHSAAVRMVCDSRLAEDVTQNAFVELARNATKLCDRPVLSGWLHCTARNLAANVVRSEVRRRVREQEAVAMNEVLSSTPEASWEEIAPHLDAALADLSEADRDAVLLRYFERKSAQQMAEVLGVSAEAAQKRVNRAVERLRDFFSRRGVSVGASGLVLALSANAVQSAPAALATAVSTAATLVGTTVVPAAAITATKAIAMTTLQKALITGTVVVLAGAGIYEGRQAANLRRQMNTLTERQAPLTEQIRQLQRERDEARNQPAAVREEGNRPAADAAELLRLRGMAGVARRATAEAEQLRAQLARQASAPATNPVLTAMTDAMQQAMERRAGTRLDRLKALLQLTPEQTDAAREILLRQARAMAVGMQQAMSGKFDKDEIARARSTAGNVDDQIKALLTPEQLASFPAYKQGEAAQDASTAANQELLQLQSTLRLKPEQLDGVYAALYQATVDQLNGSSNQKFANEGEAMQWGLDQKAKALETVLTEDQLQAYRKDQAAQARLFKDLIQKLESSRAAAK
ncbi:MAG TPA: sigma-70 family RNA polymerase sigma factor [Verrucomicrobiae bacterium]